MEPVIQWARGKQVWTGIFKCHFLYLMLNNNSTAPKTQRQYQTGYLLGTPETSLSGLRTLNALRAFISKPPPFSPTGASTPLMWLMASTITVNSLQRYGQDMIR